MNPQGHSKTGWILAGFLVVTVVVAGWISDVTARPPLPVRPGSSDRHRRRPCYRRGDQHADQRLELRAPSWAAALGPDAIVYPPQSAVPGHDNPSDAVASFFAEVKAKNLVGTCLYMDPRTLSNCKSQDEQIPASGDGELPYFSDAAIGYTVMDGIGGARRHDRHVLLARLRAEVLHELQPGRGLLGRDKTFSQLWNQAVNSTASGYTYTLAPAVLVNGGWYLYGD